MRAKRTHAAAAGIITGAVKSVFGNDDGDIDIGERAGEGQRAHASSRRSDTRISTAAAARAMLIVICPPHARNSLARHAVPSEQHTFVHVCVNILQWTSGRGRGVKLLTRGGVEEGATQTTDCTAHQYLLFVDAEAVISHCSHRKSFSPSFHFFHSLFFFARA